MLLKGTEISELTHDQNMTTIFLSLSFYQNSFFLKFKFNNSKTKLVLIPCLQKISFEKALKAELNK